MLWDEFRGKKIIALVCKYYYTDKGDNNEKLKRSLEKK